MRKILAGLLAGVLLLSGCMAQAAAKSDDTAAVTQQPAENAAVQGGFVENQTLDGADGIIHFSYYLPDGYDGTKTYPLIVTMPGYDRMWFGENSAGTNLEWNGVQAWTKLSEPVILRAAHRLGHKIRTAGQRTGRVHDRSLLGGCQSSLRRRVLRGRRDHVPGSGPAS